MSEYLQALRALPTAEDEFLADRRNPDAADSLLRRALEALFDVARHLLAKGLGRGSLEYREVARLSEEAGLIPSGDLARSFREMAGFRNRLTHFYAEVTPRELFAILRDDLADVEAVADALREAAARLETPGGESH